MINKERRQNNASEKRGKEEWTPKPVLTIGIKRKQKAKD